MPLLAVNGFNVVCETCGITAPGAFDENTAISNAVAAGFLSFTVPPIAPRGNQVIYVCSTCLGQAYQAAAAAFVVQQSHTPTNVIATVVGARQIDLTWTNNDANQTQICITRSLDGYIFNQIAIIPGIDTSFSDTALNPTTLYYYEIYSFNPIFGYSNNTPTVSATTLLPSTQ